LVRPSISYILRISLAGVPLRRRLISDGWLWFAFPATVFCAALSVPYLSSRADFFVALPLRHAFSLVCHQLPDRSFGIFGAPIAVCARCLGIYLGSALGLLLRTSRRIALHLLLAAVALNALDWLAEAARLYSNWLTARFVLGLALGAVATLLISSSMPLPAALTGSTVQTDCRPDP